MKTLADLIEAAEQLRALAAEAVALCAATGVRLEELRHLDDAAHSELLAGLAQLRARLQTTEARQ